MPSCFTAEYGGGKKDMNTTYLVICITGQHASFATHQPTAFHLSQTYLVFIIACEGFPGDTAAIW